MRSVVFLTVDCLRSDHVSAYGYNRPTTPNINLFADSATLYRHGYANCPGTRHAFQLLHTGISAHRIGGLGIPDGYQPLASHFGTNGYKTGGFAVNGFISRDYRYDVGFDTFYGVHDASDKYGPLYRAGKYIYDTLDIAALNENILEPVFWYLKKARSDSGSDSEGGYTPTHTDEDTVDQALDFIRKKKERNEAFFCWIHFMDAHTPYGYWPKHLQAVRGDTNVDHTKHPGREGLVTVGEEPLERVIDTYDACIRQVDEQIGRVLETIDEDTTVVITGDHGEQFGRYDEFHSGSMYSSKTQVPIIVRDPSLQPGISEDPAQHRDLPPTMLQSVGISAPDEWGGKTLQSIEHATERPVYFAYDENRAAIRTSEWKFIRYNGERELYNVCHSEKEEKDVIDENPELGEALESKLEQFLQTASDSLEGSEELSDGVDELTENVKENLDELGYI